MDAGATVMAGGGFESSSEDGQGEISQEKHSTVMGSGIASSEPSDNQKLAEAGEFEKLKELSDIGEDSAEMVGALTEIANADSPEWRVWACKMLNWQKEMVEFLKGF